MLLFPPVEPEGHPRVVLEALAAGLPVITTDRGAIAETVVEGESGFVLDHPVPDELAARVLRLLRDPELRDRMSKCRALALRAVLHARCDGRGVRGLDRRAAAALNARADSSISERRRARRARRISPRPRTATTSRDNSTTKRVFVRT